MPRDGSGVYSFPSGGAATSGQPASSSAYNTRWADILTDLNAARPVSAGGTGGTTASAARAALGVQALDADLTAIAALGYTSGSYLIRKTAADTWALITLTSAGEALLDDADAAAQRTTLGVVIGTDVQGYDADTSKTDVSASWSAAQAIPIKISGETTGALTSASKNCQVVCTGNITLPASGMTDGDIILIDPAGTARTISRPAAHTMYIADTDSASGTTSAHNLVTAKFHGSAKWTLQGAVT